MIFYLLSKLITICCGMLYPAYSSYKAIKTKCAKEYVQWMMYWIVFAIYSTVEVFLDGVLGWWFPFYYEMKILFIFWILSSTTKGGSILYKKYIHPLLSQHENEIDRFLEDAKSATENMLTRWGSRALSYVSDTFFRSILRSPPAIQPQHSQQLALQMIPSQRDSRLDFVDVTETQLVTNSLDEIENMGEYGEKNHGIVPPPTSNKLRRRKTQDGNNNNVIITEVTDSGSSTVIDSKVEENRSTIPPVGIRKEARLARQSKKERATNSAGTSSRPRRKIM